MRVGVFSGITPKGLYFVGVKTQVGTLIKSTPSPLRFLRNLINTPRESEPGIPSHFCQVCLLPVFKGVRIAKADHFCEGCYNNYSWVEWYLQNARSLTARDIYHLPVDHYTDNGHTSTLQE